MTQLSNYDELARAAAAALRANAHGDWTQPAPGMYPHQWLWDSCFIAIGLSHVEPQRAAGELRGLLRGQWSNGMLPHMIYNPKLPYRLESARCPIQMALHHIPTLAITQPPILAIAAEAVADKLDDSSRASFIAEMVPAINRYHDWLYAERDPDGTGLVSLVHPWESGMDDAPYWSDAMSELKRVSPKMALAPRNQPLKPRRARHRPRCPAHADAR